MSNYKAAVLYNLPLTLAITGKMGAGKDTLAAPFIAAGYTKIALADPLKDRVAAEAGITRAELDANKGLYRSRLQTIGEGERAADPLHWIKEWQKRRDAVEGPVVVTDVRYANEGKWMLDNGYFLVRVAVSEFIRHSRLRKLYGDVTREQLGHSSEQDVDAMLVHMEVSGLMDTMLALPLVSSGWARTLSPWRRIPGDDVEWRDADVVKL